MYFFSCLIYFLILSSVFNFVYCFRTIRTKLNPGCKEDANCKNYINSVNLVHSTSQEDDLILNFLTTTWNVYPEFLIFPDEQVTINWKDFLYGSKSETLFLTQKPNNAIGILLKGWPTPRYFKYDNVKWTRPLTRCDSRECKTETKCSLDQQKTIMIRTQISSTEFSNENLLIGPHSMLIEVILENFARSQIRSSELKLYLFNYAREKIKSDYSDEYERIQLKDEEENFFSNSSFFQWMTYASAVKDGVEVKKIRINDAQIETTSDSESHRLSNGIFKNGIPLRTVKISFDDPESDVNFVDETYDTVSWSFVIGLGQLPQLLSPEGSSSSTPLISRSTMIGLSGAALFVLFVGAIIGGIIIVRRKKTFGVSDVSYRYIVARSTLFSGLRKSEA